MRMGKRSRASAEYQIFLVDHELAIRVPVASDPSADGLDSVRSDERVAGVHNTAHPHGLRAAAPGRFAIETLRFKVIRSPREPNDTDPVSAESPHSHSLPHGTGAGLNMTKAIQVGETIPRLSLSRPDSTTVELSEASVPVLLVFLRHLRACY